MRWRVESKLPCCQIASQQYIRKPMVRPYFFLIRINISVIHHFLEYLVFPLIFFICPVHCDGPYYNIANPTKTVSISQAGLCSAAQNSVDDFLFKLNKVSHQTSSKYSYTHLPWLKKMAPSVRPSRLFACSRSYAS